MIKTLLCISMLAITSGCASIFSKSTYHYNVNSSPTGVNFAIKNSVGQTVKRGTTPEIVALPSFAGYFKKESYEVTFGKEGYGNEILFLNHKVDGWYFGNILLGGVIGMILVDPSTGAMYSPFMPTVSGIMGRGDSTARVTINVLNVKKNSKYKFTPTGVRRNNF